MKLLFICVVACVAQITLSQEIIFEDNFEKNAIDSSKWKFEETLAGGFDWQFQWFVNSPENTFIYDGILHIKPTLTADKFGEDALFNKKVVIDEKDCTASHNYGCERTGTRVHILNPIRSASIRTKTAFKFGTVEIRAKLPAGDWLRPVIKLVPKENFYGEWPRSGEIDFVEARGNRNLFDEKEESVGIHKVTSTLHYGPRYDLNDWKNSHFVHKSHEGFNENFHVYKLDWSKTGMKFLIDNEEIGNVSAKEDGYFWKRGAFQGNYKNLDNPWTQGSPMAPFDKEFYVVISLAVGGTSGYFSDNFENRNDDKPWPNSSEKALLQFWRAKDKWYKTWTSTPGGADFQIDYVKVYRNKIN